MRASRSWRPGASVTEGRAAGTAPCWASGHRDHAGSGQQRASGGETDTAGEQRVGEGIGPDGTPYEQAYTSMAHGWSTGVLPALTRELLGAEPTAPGFTRWQVSPRPGPVAWAQGRVPTPRGPLAVSWDNPAPARSRWPSRRRTARSARSRCRCRPTGGRLPPASTVGPPGAAAGPPSAAPAWRPDTWCWPTSAPAATPSPCARPGNGIASRPPSPGAQGHGGRPPAPPRHRGPQVGLPGPASASPGPASASPGPAPASPGPAPAPRASPGLPWACPGLPWACPGLPWACPGLPGLPPASPGPAPASPGPAPASPGLPGRRGFDRRGE